MTRVVHDVRQRSPEWFALRSGKLTGSCAKDIIKQRQRGTGELEGRAKLRGRLLAERLTGLQKAGALTAAMERGRDCEAAAVAAYEAVTGQLVTRVGFVSHAGYQAGCSPDGVIGAYDGILEVKCPESATHLAYLQAGTVPEEYLGQCLHALWITEADWVDFVSFDDRFAEPLDFFVVRFMRDDATVAAYAGLALRFLDEVDVAEAELRARLAQAVSAA